jgi:hypothetical protein
MLSRLLGIPIAVLLAAAAPMAQNDLKPYKQCLDGPQGLKACTLSYLVPELAPPGHATMDDVLPQRLIVYRYGRRLFSVKNGPFIWNFAFLENGKELAFAQGPLHFGMMCHLVLSATGKEVAQEDCFSSDEKSSKWVSDLESQEGHQLSPEPFDWAEVSK